MKKLYRLTYAKESDLEQVCLLVCMLEQDEEPDRSIVIREDLYILIAAYESSEQPERFVEDARADVQEYMQKQAEMIRRNYSLPSSSSPAHERDSASATKLARAVHQVEEERQSAYSGESEARAVIRAAEDGARARYAESVWDSDGAEETGEACSKSTVSDWRPSHYTRLPYVPIYTGDEECDKYWEKINAERLKNYKLGIHKHVQQRCDNAYTEQCMREIINKSKNFHMQLTRVRDSLNIQWEEEDRIRSESMDDEEEAERVRNMYKRLLEERALKVKQRAREAARNKKINKNQHPEEYAQLIYEDKLEAARKKYLRACAKNCTEERVQEELRRLDNIREYRFYTALLEGDKETLPKEDREKNIQRLLDDKQFIMSRMRFLEHRRVKLLSKGEIYALSIDDFIMWKRMQGEKTSEWSWGDAVLKYQQYCVELGLIIGINEMEEEQNRVQREAFQESKLEEFMSSERVRIGISACARK